MPWQKDGVIPAVMPLPAGWEEAKSADGKSYYIDHNKRNTSWIDPRDRLIKPKTFADCIGPELPLGWEECYDSVVSTYYVDHNREINQLEDPRQQWHEEQERMLREYLKNAELDLEAQHDIINVKERRLHLAQEKLDYLTTEFEKTSDELVKTYPEEVVGLNKDTTSTESMIKYNPDELKEDIANARERVHNLKREMQEASDDILHQQEGMKKLELISQTHFENGTHKVEGMRDKVNEMKEVRERLILGEQEKIQILQELLRQKDEYQATDLSSYVERIGGSTTSLNSSGSVCNNPGSQYMGSDENIGIALSKRQLQKDYQLAMLRVKDLHAALEFVDYQLEANQSGHEQHRYMLFNEKQILLTELDRFAIYIRTEEERIQLEYEKEQLIQDLVATKEMSSKVIEDRMQLQNEQDYLKQQLQDKNRQTNLLELKLKSLSASTLSVSSTSSRGSISTGSRGSLSASSCGSLNSLSLHGDVGGNDHYASFCHLPSNTCPPIYESHILATKAETTEGLSTTTTTGDHQSPYMSSSNVSRYSRESIPSLSPPISPLTADIPHKIAEVPGCGNASLFHVDTGNTHSCGNMGHNINKCEDGSYRSYATFPLASYQCTMGSSNDISNHFEQTVHNAVSNESVAADSGVFESFNELRKSSVTRQDSGHSSGVYCSDYNVETAQIRIGLEYRCTVGKLALTIEKGRNIKALCFQPLKHIYVNGNLLPPSGDQNFNVRTRISINTDRPCFNEQFLFTIDRNKLLNKTLQLDLFGLLMETNHEECLGCAQISLAEFDSNQEIGLKWYNLLGTFTSTSQSHSLNKSDSNTSLESMQQRFNMLPGLLASSEEGLNNNYDGRLRSNSCNRDQICETRDRANSNEDRRSVNSNGSQSNLTSNSLCGSTERMHRPQLSSCMRPHLRSKSDEREEQVGDVNIGRSASDCTGCRKSPLRAPFIRMGVCRRSIRQSRLAELKSKKSVPTLVAMQPKHETRHIVQPQSTDQYTIQTNTPATPLNSEMQIQAAYSKQESEISHLKEIKQMMEQHRMGGNEDISQWLVENGDNFHALLDEAKKEYSSHLCGLTSLSESNNKKFTNLTKMNPNHANVVGRRGKMGFSPTHKTDVSPNPEIHWV